MTRKKERRNDVTLNVAYFPVDNLFELLNVKVSLSFYKVTPVKRLQWKALQMKNWKSTGVQRLLKWYSDFY